MSDAITSILTDANARSEASVGQKLLGDSEKVFSAWFNIVQE